MTLSAEIIEIEHSLRKAGVSLDAVLANAHIARSTWTRWKNGSVKGARYDTMSRVRASADAALKGRAHKHPKPHAGPSA
jgi:hypothetical protein